MHSQYSILISPPIDINDGSLLSSSWNDSDREYREKPHQDTNYSEIEAGYFYCAHFFRVDENIDALIRISLYEEDSYLQMHCFTAMRTNQPPSTYLLRLDGDILRCEIEYPVDIARPPTQITLDKHKLACAYDNTLTQIIRMG